MYNEVLSIYECSGFSSCIAILRVMKGAPGVSHVTHATTYLYGWKNEVSSHSYIGHCLTLRRHCNSGPRFASFVIKFTTLGFEDDC